MDYAYPEQSSSLRLFHGLRALALYVLLGAGGLWHLIGVFETTMRLLAGPVMILLGVWMGLEYRARVTPVGRRGFFLWSAGVITGSFVLEWIGVTTGTVFGQYGYGGILQPELFSVPVAIGFAWLTMLLASYALAKAVLRSDRGWMFYFIPVMGSLLMVGFDLLLEPAAQHLGYWQWNGGSVPLRNYLVWFLASLCFLTVGHFLRLLPKRIVRFGIHAYIAQMVYFGLVLVG